MPATVTYVSVTPQHAIPIRIFVHRKHVLAENQIAVNEKSILTLSATASIRLSNYDLNNLWQDLGPYIWDVVASAKLTELFPKRTVSRTSVVIQEISNKWKCKLVVSLGYIVDLRYALNQRFSASDVQFLETHKLVPQASRSSSSALLERNFSFSFMEPDADQSLISLDEKKQIKYSLKSRSLMNNKLTDSLTLYVLSRPRS